MNEDDAAMIDTEQALLGTQNLFLKTALSFLARLFFFFSRQCGIYYIFARRNTSFHP